MKRKKKEKYICDKSLGLIENSDTGDEDIQPVEINRKNFPD